MSFVFRECEIQDAFCFSHLERRLTLFVRKMGNCAREICPQEGIRVKSLAH